MKSHHDIIAKFEVTARASKPADSITITGAFARELTAAYKRKLLAATLRSNRQIKAASFKLRNSI